MFSLSERLHGIARILEESNAALQINEADATGFIPVLPELLIDSMLKMTEFAQGKTSLDLGCGNGGWLLMAAAAGFPSYGIEINALLVDHAQENYLRAVDMGFIDAAVPCVIITGDMIPSHFSKEYDSFRKSHTENERSMPIAPMVEDSYARLPVSIATADIVYCWAWPTQSRFVFNMLDKEAKRDVIFVLPSYQRYTQGEHMNAMFKEENKLIIAPLAVVREVVIGRRAE